MVLRHVYAPEFPEMDPFLFASVGEEVNGIPLSVLSALARLGVDPRDEATRLSHLTSKTAASQLARMFARYRTAPGPHRRSEGLRASSSSYGPRLQKAGITVRLQAPPTGNPTP
jgi:hypothetical protein